MTRTGSTWAAASKAQLLLLLAATCLLTIYAFHLDDDADADAVKSSTGHRDLQTQSTGNFFLDFIVSIWLFILSLFGGGGGELASTFDVTLDMALVPILDRFYFTQAAAKWKNVIKGDLSDVAPGSNKPTYSGCNYPALIDDVYVCARIAKDDGKGGTLAYAGPDRLRGGIRGLPYSGFISFDQDDVQTLKDNGTFQNVIEHEMGHILGIGSIWSDWGITGSGSSCPYLGTHANNEYKALTGCARIPTELDGGSGTKCVHFDETCLNNELMTGFINFNTPNPLSRMTVGALDDLGYEVDYTKADAFSRSDIPSSCYCGVRSLAATTQQVHTSSSSSTVTGIKRRRRLSEEMENYAISRGQEFLQEQAQRVDAMEGDGAGVSAEEPLFIGDQFVSVWVQDDDGSIYSVDVWADS